MEETSFFLIIRKQTLTVKGLSNKIREEFTFQMPKLLQLCL